MRERSFGVTGRVMTWSIWRRRGDGDVGLDPDH